MAQKRRGTRARFADQLRQALADRGVSLTRVLDRDGPNGVMSIADDAAASLDRLTTNEDTRLALVAGEIGALIGFAVGLTAQQTRGHVGKVH